MILEAILQLASAVCALALIAVGSNGLRRRLIRPPVRLKPNCLLTKHPVEFWTGVRTPFYFMHFWNGLPVFLAAHGYDVRLVRFPWRDSMARRITAERCLLQGRRHVVVDKATADEFADLFKLFPPNSLTVLDRRGPAAAGADRFCFELHRGCLRMMGWQGSFPEAASLGLGPKGGRDVKAELLTRIRLAAENDWADPDFPLESPATP